MVASTYDGLRVGEKGGYILSIRSFDRAQDAFNLAKKEPVQQKVMVFVIPSKVKQGIVYTELRFPYNGKLSSLYASCGMAGQSTTKISLEKCPQSLYETVPEWESVLSSELELLQDNKASSSYVVSNPSVDAGDHFRVNVVEVGEGVQDITITVIVDI